RTPFEARAFASRFPLCDRASTVLTLTRPASIAGPCRGRPLRSEQSGGGLDATGGCLVGAQNEYPLRRPFNADRCPAQHHLTVAHRLGAELREGARRSAADRRAGGP